MKARTITRQKLRVYTKEGVRDQRGKTEKVGWLCRYVGGGSGMI